MKKLILVLLAGTTFSCNNDQTSSTATTDSPATTAETSTPMNYPYTIDKPDNWQMGSNANTMVALSALKAWEEGNMDKTLTYFADTVRMQFDGLDERMPKDSIKAMFTKGWNDYKDVHIRMQDWESVVSKDKSEEWVTMWYRQSWETKKGVKDSIDVINDFMMKDGKIVRLDEYTRKLH